LTTVAWISKAARAFLQQFNALNRQIEESIRRVEQYIADLNEAFNIYSTTEARLAQQASALRTDVFGV
jgi:exonuclease VII small subunit